MAARLKSRVPALRSRLGRQDTLLQAVREGLARGDYRDPGWYRHPPGTVAYEWKA